jgi:quercetin dioxygenase-like cupin family protein
MDEADRRRLVEIAPRHGIHLLPSAASDAPRPATREPPEKWDVFGARVERLATLGAGPDDLVLLRELLPPGLAVPLHAHADPECFFVIAGGIELYRAGQGWRPVAPDEAAHVAPGVAHALRNTGSVSAHVLMVTTRRMAEFFGTIGAPAAGHMPRPPSRDELAAFPGHVAAYGYHLATPAENAAIGLAPPG